METNDADLLQRWRQGDRKAGKELFERYYDALERFFVNKVSTGIGDMVQETFRLCVEARDRIHEPNRFRSYLFSIAYNVLRGHYRSRSRHGTEVDWETVSLQDSFPGPNSMLIEREEQRLLLEALRNIPAPDQTLFELYYWESLKLDEIAVVLEVEPSKVKGRLHRARARLRKKIVELADSPEVLESTLADLDDWARECRGRLGRLSSVAS